MTSTPLTSRLATLLSLFFSGTGLDFGSYRVLYKTFICIILNLYLLFSDPQLCLNLESRLYISRTFGGEDRNFVLFRLTFSC